jgi:hypothetical protein
VSTQCDNCLTNLTWKYDVRKEYLETKQSLQAFCLSVAGATYKRILLELLGEAAKVPAIPIFNLCPKCWANQSSKWCENGAEIYKTIPAKTADSGIYFNNARQEFHQAGGQAPDLPVIQSTLVHEMMHFCSNDHNGLQAFESGKPTHWDECCTDFLARKIFLEISPSYRTFYGTLSEFIKYALNRLFTTDWTTFSNKQRLQAIGLMPEPFSLAAASLENKKFKAEFKDPIEKALTRMFITWHQKGQGVMVAPTLGGGTTYTVNTFLTTKIAEVGFAAFNDTNAKYGTAMSFKDF